MIGRGCIALLLSLLVFNGAMGQQRPRAPAPPPAPPPAVQPEPPPPVFEPQLLKLAEILGALTALGEVCRADLKSATGESAGEDWRNRMRDLIDVEAQTAGQKERMAGAFNRGLTTYRISHRTCTPAGRLALERLLREGAGIAADLASRYGT